jgi:coenzyme F420 hydrogenase subunit beta
MPTDRLALQKKFFSEDSLTAEIGPFRGLYLTRATDDKIRENAQHGGTMTALLELAINEGFIDSAVLTRSKGGLDAEGVLATTAEEIRACSGSSFQIPPTLAVLNKTLNEDVYHKIGVVGTPCKTLAVYKMKAKPVADNDNHIDNVGMVFGLFCGWGLEWKDIHNLTAKYAVPEKVSHMDIPPSKYHSLVLREDGKEISVNLDEVTPIVRPACHACIDMTAEFSDLSVGGARSADGWDVDKGWNQVIVRTEKGEQLINLAREKGILEFKDVPETGLDKIKNASLGKKRNGEAYKRTIHV